MVQQSSLPPRPEVTERAEPISIRGAVQQISDCRTLAVEQLAKHLAAATISYQMGVSFDTAMRKYVEPHGRLGEMWERAAEFILDNQAADNSPTPGPELVGSGQPPGGNAA